MKKRISFSNSEVSNIFAVNSYSDFSHLMYDTARNQEKVSKEEANQKIREIMFQVLGIEPTSDLKTIRKALRRHKADVYEVIEETVDNLLVSGWGDNPFFNEFLEIKNLAAGDRNEFYAQDDVILTVSELAGSHHDLLRQRLGEGSSFSIKTSWYGIKIYTDYDLFMAGRIDWAAFVQKIYEAMDKFINDMVYQAVMASGDKVLPASQFNKTGALVKDDLITLAEDVQAATGDEVVIMGTKTALSKLTALSDTQWISNEMKQERHTTGRLGLWEGIRLVEIPQSFAPNDTTKKQVDNNKLLFMPAADNRFIKLVYEGESNFNENTDPAVNMDMSVTAEYQTRLGVATVIGKKFGMWTITE